MAKAKAKTKTKTKQRTKNKQTKRAQHKAYTQQLKKELLVGVRCQKNFA